MKKTEYFTSIHAKFTGLNTCVEDAKNKRDRFLDLNKDSIAKIDSEDIKVISGSPSNQHVHNIMVIIRLTYFPIR